MRAWPRPHPALHAGVLALVVLAPLLASPAPAAQNVFIRDEPNIEAARRGDKPDAAVDCRLERGPLAVVSVVLHPTPTHRPSWGGLKLIYRP